MEKNDVVTLKADWTDPDDEIELWLKRFDSISIPLTAVFPAERPMKPLVLRDVYSKSKLHDTVRQAVAMKADPAAAERRTSDTASLRP